MTDEILAHQQLSENIHRPTKITRLSTQILRSCIVQLICIWICSLHSLKAKNSFSCLVVSYSKLFISILGYNFHFWITLLFIVIRIIGLNSVESLPRKENIQQIVISSLIPKPITLGLIIINSCVSVFNWIKVTLMFHFESFSLFSLWTWNLHNKFHSWEYPITCTAYEKNHIYITQHKFMVSSLYRERHWDLDRLWNL